MGHRVWDQVVTLNVGFIERLQTFKGSKETDASHTTVPL